MREPAEYDLEELSRRAGVNSRTVRYYVQEGLLPAPDRGRGARYTDEHLDRIRLIRRLQEEHLPLAKIRSQLEGLAWPVIREILARQSKRPKNDAASYISEVLSGGPPTVRAVRDWAASADVASHPPDARPERSHWERIAVSPQIELHVRRGQMSKAEKRLLDALLSFVRQFNEEEGP